MAKLLKLCEFILMTVHETSWSYTRDANLRKCNCRKFREITSKPMFSDVFVFFREFLIAGNHKIYFEIAGFPAIAGEVASLMPLTKNVECIIFLYFFSIFVLILVLIPKMNNQNGDFTKAKHVSFQKSIKRPSRINF